MEIKTFLLIIKGQHCHSKYEHQNDQSTFKKYFQPSSQQIPTGKYFIWILFSGRFAPTYLANFEIDWSRIK